MKQIIYISIFLFLYFTGSTHIKNNPDESKEIKLIRFDKLSEENLFNFVDSLIYKVVMYDSSFVDSTYLQNLDSREIASLKKRIELGYKTNPEPMILLNAHSVENKEILKKFKMTDVLKIKYLTTEQASPNYGYHALNGVIDISVRKKKFKKEWKIHLKELLLKA
ncbi:hypothetical protein [Plebeiibacterium sediminum]|uniref:Uncharacterized protein n=1 Tax=Plebeiibacterium sediminum TaxID=2992112 RepID=A0AAE3SEM1_9BACT|nr:hypothetical protein [Plebeiobacterium sediminum]MCW3786525.1 hypothetical protein [Plebeiobacterium sediminum]